MRFLKEGDSLAQAASRAGMSEPTARKYARSGLMPTIVKVAHTWRTRPDPFKEVWPEIEALLGHPVFLELKVKVRPKWRRDAATLERLGL